MTTNQFKKSRSISQVRRTNLPNQKVRNVLGINLMEGLIRIDEPSYFGGETWLRYENCEIISAQEIFLEDQGEPITKML